MTTMPSNDGAVGVSRQYVFIQGKDTYNKAVRAHVLKDHMKKRRDDALCPRHAREKARTSTCPLALLGEAVPPTIEYTLHGVTLRQQELYDYFRIHSVQQLWDVKMDTPCFNPIRDIVIPTLQSEKAGLVVQALFGYNLMCKNFGRDPDSEATELQNSIIKYIRLRCKQKDTKADDISILLLTGLTLLNIDLGEAHLSTPELQIHFTGFRSMIMARGGWDAIAKTRVGWHSHWVDIVSAGALSQGRTPLSWLVGNGRGDVTLQVLASECCALFRLFATTEQVNERQPELFYTSLRCRLLDSQKGPNQLWDRLRSSTLIYLLICLCIPPCQEPTELRQKLMGLGNQPTRAPAQFFFNLITNVKTLRIADPPKVWLLTRCLFVMSRLNLCTRARLDKFLLQALSRCLNYRLCRRIDGDDSPDQVLEFTALELAIWKDLSLPAPSFCIET